MSTKDAEGAAYTVIAIFIVGIIVGSLFSYDHGWSQGHRACLLDYVVDKAVTK
jgi:hypothetical protein